MSSHLNLNPRPFYFVNKRVALVEVVGRVGFGLDNDVVY